MKFTDVAVQDAKLVSLDKIGDDRGFFARAFCENEFTAAGLTAHVSQINNSLGGAKGTLRGMHYQLEPSAEVKIVRCIRGSIWDCILDLRPDSSTFGKHYGVTLSSENRNMLYVPKGFAHAILTLEDNTEIFYFSSTPYNPSLERGVRWNDPRFAIEWPIPPVVISDKDQSWPDFDEKFHQVESLRGLI